VPLYEVHEVAGPDHDRIFMVAVSVGGKVLGTGRAPRIRWAENEAARVALKALLGGKS
jgi:dsRNA-specific ribonuclease